MARAGKLRGRGTAGHIGSMPRPTEPRTRAAQPFLDAREFLLTRRERYDEAARDFRWPALDRFNWALDWFDAYAAGNDRPALRLVREDGSETRRSFAELAERSSCVANML